MRSASARLALAALLAGCGGAPSTQAPAGPTVNQLAVTVNGAHCSAAAYANEPCVEVTVCVPGTSTCQTVDGVLLDTGSYGLRIFQQVLTLPLPRVGAGSGTLATCVQFADGSSHWGPVARATVRLAGEPAVDTAIQVIDATFGAVPAGCTKPDRTPLDAGYNGVLGVGPFAQDCGEGCASSADNGIYYSCDASRCAGAAVPVPSQLQNPIALLPTDGNGLVVDLPAVAAGGVPFVAGSVLLGVGTRANNAPAGATSYALAWDGTFTTSIGGAVTSGFVDTGSNGLFFAAPYGAALPACPSPDDTWFCPASTVSLDATNAAASGSPSSRVDFRIGNFDALAASPNAVFGEIGGPALPAEGFDWGLPFHLGRRVFIGIEGKSSPLGVGPYVAW